MERLLAAAPPMPLIRLTRPILHALAGDLDLARAEFGEFRHLPETFPFGVRWLGTVTQIGYLSILLDDAEAAEAVRRRLARYAGSYLGDGSGAVLHLGAADGLLADLTRVAGRTDDAAALYERAVELDVRIGARPFTARARLGWARTLAAQGSQQRRAMSLLDQAVAEFRRLNMPGPLRAASSVRDDIGKRSLGTSLTTREREVARLISAALSNNEIATRLTLSERTVETHVHNILAKLGYTTRTQIATWALGEHGR